jgi:hypothetical protein
VGGVVAEELPPMPEGSERPAELLEWYPSRPAMFEHLKKLSFEQGHSIKTMAERERNTNKAIPGSCGSNNKKAVYVCSSYPDFNCCYYVCAVKHRWKDEDGAFESWGPRKRKSGARPDNFYHSADCPSVRTLSYKELARLPAVVDAIRDNPNMKLKTLAALVTESGVPVSALTKKDGASHQFLYRAMKIAKSIALGPGATGVPTVPPPLPPGGVDAPMPAAVEVAASKKRRVSSFALEDRLSKWVVLETSVGCAPPLSLSLVKFTMPEWEA